ncbi:MAG: hypothetical protein K0V04_38215 [Deltaproteobacteria bacterium]|nr:hypothetical protein [Deltaproteobacteria bacterium]
MSRAASILLLLAVSACRPSTETAPPSHEPATGSNPVAAVIAADPVRPPPVAQPAPASSRLLAESMPGSFTLLLGIDIAALQDTSFWADLHTIIAAELSEPVGAMEECGVGSRTWRALAFGMDTLSRIDEPMAVALSATGLGRADTLACIASELASRRDGQPPWNRRSTDGAMVFTDDTTAYVIDNDTVVWSSAAAGAAVEQRLRGGGPSIFEGPLRPALVRTDTRRPLWFAGTIPRATPPTLLADDMGEPRNAAGWMDMRSGLEVLVSIAVESPGAAARVRTAAISEFPQFQIMAQGMGIPETTLDSVEFGTMGDAFTVSVFASASDVEKIQQRMMEVLFPEDTSDASDPARRH